jgi:hypothetical protein
MSGMKEISSKQTCPICGGNVVPIVYGDPMEEIWEMSKRGEVVLGGCCIEVDKEGNSLMPEWACTNCDYRK